MLASDRPEFDRQIAVLCAGYNVPVGDRPEAYWAALNRFTLPQVARLVETVLADPGAPERIPTAKQLLAVHFAARRATRQTLSGSQASQSRMVEAMLQRHRLSDWQRRSVWNWHRTAEHELLAVSVEADPSEPGTYPAHRLEAVDL